MERGALRIAGAIAWAALVVGASDAPRTRPMAPGARGSWTRPPALTREQMEARVGAAEGFLAVYGTQDPDAAPVLRAIATRIARRMPGGDTSCVRADRDVVERDLALHGVLLLGGPAANLWTRRLAPGLPVRFTARGFRWFGRAYERPGDVIHLAYPNPLDRSRFLFVIAGNSAGALTPRGAGFLSGAEDWRIYRGGESVRSGRFAQSPGHPWTFDAALDRDRETERERFATRQVIHGAGAVRVRAPAGSPTAAAILRAAEGLAARSRALGLASRGTPIVLTLYGSLEEKGWLSLNTRSEHVDPAGEAHAACPAGWNAPDLWSVPVAGLIRAGASTGSRFLEPAGIWIAERFEGEALEAAVRRLVLGGLWLEARAAARRPGGWKTPLVWMPCRAVLARAVFECAGASGPQALLALLRRDPPGTLDSLCAAAGVEASRVAARYSALSDSLARAGAGRERQAAPRPWRPEDGFQRGVCLAHSVRPEGGYLSAACGRELERLRDDGVAWISLTPFGYLAAGSPEIAPSSAGGGEEETDEAVCEVAARARALGMRVWLKPHLWSRGWIGELEFGAGDWERFFEGYREFILHYALLAQREGLDGLVLGHELVSATRGRDDRWREIAGAVRRVYSGTLTYGANWGEEVERVGFWDALDLVGVSFYAPLADRPTTSVAALRAGAGRALAALRAVSARCDRPVVLLEAGYPAQPEAPVRPWQENRGSADPEAQRACYQALVEALESESWVAGVYWWKWFSAGGPEGPTDASYSPRGKPAERVLRQAMGVWQRRPVQVTAAGAAGSARP